MRGNYLEKIEEKVLIEPKPLLHGFLIYSYGTHDTLNTHFVQEISSDLLKGLACDNDSCSAALVSLCHLAMGSIYGKKQFKNLTQKS